MAAETSLRALKKDRTRDQLARIAIELFDEHGFDGVTVDQIAAAAEVSPRTFFRYFGTKEAVLFADQDEILALLRDSIAARPADEPPLVALREALVSVTAAYVADRDRHLRMTRLARSGAEIVEYQRAVLLRRWEEELSAAVAARLGVDADDDVRPRLLAGVAIAVTSAVSAQWSAGNGTADPEVLLVDAFGLLTEAALEAGDHS